MSPASGDSPVDKQSRRSKVRSSFHSINVPSEWGLTLTVNERRSQLKVSIQLMSPASGDHCAEYGLEGYYEERFHSINVPSEWGQVKSPQPIRVSLVN